MKIDRAEIGQDSIGTTMLTGIGAPLGPENLKQHASVATSQESEEQSVSGAISHKDYTDRSMDAVRAQNDARFAEVLTEIKSLRGVIDAKPSTWQMVGAVFAGAATILGVILTALSFAGDRFDGGVGLADQRQEQLQRDADQDAIIKRLDALLAVRTTPLDQTSAAPIE